MGLFDRLAGKKPSPTTGGASDIPAPENSATAAPSNDAANAGSPPAPVGAASESPAAGGVIPRLVAAREKLETKDLAGALAVYEEVLAGAGDRADVLVTISGDLGATGHVASIIDLVAPRYDANRHGPATGLNLLQAYLSVRDPDAAQHVLDILFTLNRPELEERLYGFSNAIAELLSEGTVAGLPEVSPLPDGGGPGQATKFSLVSISKPIWFYGLEGLSAEILPEAGRPRRIAFAQLALPGAYADPTAASGLPEDELGRLSRALPLWLAETFFFSSSYAAIAAVGIADSPGRARHPAVFPAEWTIDNLKQLVETTQGGLDYVFTGALREKEGVHELLLRVWEVRKYRERKQFTVRWTRATADAELTKLHEQVRKFMEWTPFPQGVGLPYTPPAASRAWLDALSLSVGLFLVEKTLMPKEQLPELAPAFDAFAPHAFSPPSASLAWLTLRARASALGFTPPLAEVLLSPHPSVARARALLKL